MQAVQKRDLTPAERCQRAACMIGVGASDHAIAALLGLTPNAVSKMRQRIKDDPALSALMEKAADEHRASLLRSALSLVRKAQ